QFDSLEDKLDEKALDNSKQAVTTIINVGVAVAEENDPISPLLNGIAQVGFEVIGELTISADINATLVQLESAWEQLDEATLQLAQVTLVINQMTAITNATHKTIEALNAIVNDWQTIADCINDTTTWSSTGANQLKEWAARMAHVQFYGQVSQTVTPSS
ncbi:MAG: hypothetical protein OXE99_09670, partial [Cellvibrionales bacterium]|nr:hypothetical protein [Cellvibrionales bacterium]